MSSRETTGTAAQQELLARAYRQVEAARLVSEFATDLNAAVNLFEVALPVGIYFRQQPGFDQVCLIALDAADSMVGLRDSPERPADVQLFEVSGADDLLNKLVQQGQIVTSPPADPAEFESLLGHARAKTILAVPLNARRDRVGCLIAVSQGDDIDIESALDSVQHAAMPLSTAVERIVAFERSQLEANTDTLTGLFNRRYFLDHLHIEVQKCKRVDYPLGLLLLDIDHFKIVNDTYGHVVGDHVLADAAASVMRTVRDVDVPARYGGEEFVVILVGCTRDGMPAIAERVRRDIESNISVKDGDTVLRPITVSVGAASFDRASMTRESFVDAADKALYHAKETGRNRVVLDGDY